MGPGLGNRANRVPGWGYPSTKAPVDGRRGRQATLRNCPTPKAQTVLGNAVSGDLTTPAHEKRPPPRIGEGGVGALRKSQTS